MSIIDHLNGIGYYAFALEAGTKFPPPSGWTGYSKKVSEDMVYEQIEKEEAGEVNVGISLPHGIVGIDIDSCETPESESVRKIARESWRVSSGEGEERFTAFFSLPMGVSAGDLKDIEGVDLISETHRYSIINGTHPSGREYRIFSPSAEVSIEELPEPDELPYLPESIIVLMKREKEEKKEAKKREKRDWTIPDFDSLSCPAASKTAKRGAEIIYESRHLGLLKAMKALSELSLKGHAIGDLPIQLAEIFISEAGESRRKEAWRILGSTPFQINYGCSCSQGSRGFFIDHRLLRATGLQEEEVVSEVFIKESKRGFEHEGKRRKFRELSAKNLMLDIIKKAENRERAEASYGRAQQKNQDVFQSQRLKESIDSIASSDREKKICYLIAYGFSSEEIGKRLDLSRKSIERAKKDIRDRNKSF